MQNSRTRLKTISLKISSYLAVKVYSLISNFISNMRRDHARIKNETLLSNTKRNALSLSKYIITRKGTGIVRMWLMALFGSLRFNTKTHLKHLFTSKYFILYYSMYISPSITELNYNLCRNVFSVFFFI